MEKVNPILEKAEELIAQDTGNFSVMTCEQIRNKFCPHARGTMNGGIMVPHHNICIGNAFTKTYLDQLSFSQHGVDFWIKMCKLGLKQDILMNTVQLNKMHSLAQHETIPYVLYRSHPESWKFRFCSLYEWSRYTGNHLVIDLLKYLYHLVIFGMKMDSFHIETVFRLENPYEFVAARLFQGIVDQQLMHLHSNPISIFVPSHLAYEPGFDGTIDLEVTGDEFNEETKNEIQGKVRDHQIQAMNSTYVSNGTDFMHAVAKSKMSIFPKHYREYMQTSSPLKKVGTKIFDNITTGRGAMGRGQGAGLGHDFQQSLDQNRTRSMIQQFSQLSKHIIPKTLQDNTSNII